MEKRLRELFEYQRFIQNKDLQFQIDEVLYNEDEGYISDDLLVSIAGGKNNIEDRQGNKK